jgi:hypothetical protein
MYQKKLNTIFSSPSYSNLSPDLQKEYEERIKANDIYAIRTLNVEDGISFRVPGPLLVRGKIGNEVKTFYLHEGDVSVTKAEHDVAVAAENTKAAGGSTFLLTQERMRWDPSVAQNLTWWIDEQTFKGDIEVGDLRQHMLLACADWEKTCNVKFKQVFNKAEALFTVVYFIPDNKSDLTGLIAFSFFPTSARIERQLAVCPAFAKLTLDPDPKDDQIPGSKTGTVRHELGHILGFRHEHIRNYSLGLTEPLVKKAGKYVELTEYDKESVMHYPVRGPDGEPYGTYEMKISNLDAKGAVLWYGLPSREVKNVRPAQ